ncbi:unnamed protein product [Urochloa decumbens]|uniref:Peroxidase n=1 Tax=Urochloa decumbens TaxID=240449 RepID=A0ABC9G1Z6_9POAL
MASASSCLSLLVLASAAAAQNLSPPTFYDTSCPNALSTIKSAVNAAVAQEPRMGASLLRLHFHDCFGCDASVLLNDTATFTGEQGAGPNVGSIRGFAVVDNIKAQIEALCPQTVSCADILAVAARDSVVALGGPSWTMLLGRRDSATASLSLANTDIPAPNSSLSQLIAAFNKKILNPTDMVALSGAHTIGQARCTTFRDHIYSDTNINQAFAMSLKGSCPAGSGGANVMAPLDTTTPNAFDNAYYTNLLNQRGLLHSDQELSNNGASTDSIVSNFSSNATAFSSAFATAMVKMGNISPKTGSQGQIRVLCSRVNAS